MENKDNKNEDEGFLLIEEELNKNPKLTKYLKDNIEIILRIIDKFPRNKKKKINKVLDNGIEISDTAYKTLCLHIQKKFPEHSITPQTLSSMLTRIKKKMKTEQKNKEE